MAFSEYNPVATGRGQLMCSYVFIPHNTLLCMHVLVERAKNCVQVGVDTVLISVYSCVHAVEPPNKGHF